MEGPRYIYSQREGEMNRERRNSGMRKQQWSHLRDGCVPMSPLTRSAPDMLYLLSPILHQGKRWNKFIFFYLTYFYLTSNQTIRSLSLYFENRSDRHRDGAVGKLTRLLWAEQSGVRFLADQHWGPLSLLFNGYRRQSLRE